MPEAIALSDAFGYTDWELDRYVSGAMTGDFKELTGRMLIVLWEYTTAVYITHFGIEPRRNRLTSLKLRKATLYVSRHAITQRLTVQIKGINQNSS